MGKLQAQRQIFAALLAALLTAAGPLCPPAALAAEEAQDPSAQEAPVQEAGVPTQELADLAGTASLREMLDRKLSGRLEGGEVREKTPAPGSPTATDILAATQVIAHGMGEAGGVATLNCLEGFLENYAKGVRVFEVDLRLTSDGKVVLRHDWRGGWQEGISESVIPTREEFLSLPILEGYTPLSFQDLLLLLDEYPDVAVVTDSKFTDPDVAVVQFGAMTADAKELGLSYVFDRILIQFYNQNMRDALANAYHYPHYIYTLYNEGFSGTESAFRTLADYCARHGVEGITMWDTWWKPAFAPIAQEYGIRVYVHTVNDAAAAKELLASGVSAVYTDSLTDAGLQPGA